MFLLPHHSQEADRLGAEHVIAQHRWDQRYGWGLRACELELAELASFRFAVRTLQARWKDGTTVAIPEEGVLTALDLNDAFERSNTVTVHLAVPERRAGRANVADTQSATPK
jgi:predicted component of type VI protein secretion system